MTLIDTVVACITQYSNGLEVLFSFLQFIVTILILVVAYSQLSRIRRTHSAQLISELDKQIIKLEVEIVTLYYDAKGCSGEKLYLLKKTYDYKTRVYYDLMDRLCFYLLNRYVEGSQWKQEYKEIVRDIVENLKKSKPDELDKMGNLSKFYKECYP